MTSNMDKRTEHAGAKNGGGHWGTREEAKTLSKRARRITSKQIIQEGLFESHQAFDSRDLPLRVISSLEKTFADKVNCFCVSEFFFRNTQFRQVTADEMLTFVAENFEQLEGEYSNTLTLVWSRSSFDMPVGGIHVRELAKRPPGFPFGLILEHSFVQIDKSMVFQKADPTVTSKIEITSVENAIEPYAGLNGFELTRHILRSQF